MVIFEVMKEFDLQEHKTKALNIVTLQEAMEAIDTYLNAGYKEQRATAHLKGKDLYERYYNKEYVNRNER